MAVVLQKDVAPEKKNSITKSAMLEFVKTHGTDDDKKWFKELCYANKETKKSHLPGVEEVEGLNIVEVRKAFIKKFYPDAYKKEKKQKAKKPTFFEELDSL